MNSEIQIAKKRRLRAMLIFNPGSGATDESPVQLMEIIDRLQEWKIIPETFLVEPECDLPAAVAEAVRRGLRLFIVCGGDGTIESVAAALVGTQATLGIIPTGTRNNVALSLGIPKSIPEAVALIRTGRRIKVDVGVAVSQEKTCYFLETCSIGLFAALYPSSDEIQHGKLSRIGDFLITLFSFPAFEIRLAMDKQPPLKLKGHVAMVSNFPYVGPNYRVAHDYSYDDGYLHVMVISEQSKLEILNNAMAGNDFDDPRILRYRVKSVEIETDPPVPAVADGCMLSEGPLRVTLRRRGIAMMAGTQTALNITEGE